MARGVSTSCSSMMGRPPSRDERALWRAAMQGVVPLAEGDVPTAAAPVASASERRAPKASGAKLAPPALPPLAPGTAAGVDRRSVDRLRRGALEIEARLDLHGMTQAEAHRALDTFLERAQAAERRCVLVITGKGGRGSGDGILRAAVPRWLNEAPNRGRLLAFAPAQTKHGGAGALYLLLRRRR
jgi:DNA-nicking Smr family endonuclease